MEKWIGIRNVTERSSGFPNESGRLGVGEFHPSPKLLKNLQSQDTRVLVVGAGGLGCEVKFYHYIVIQN
jgi:hypothetical protein